jgi:hypothetical protein
MKKLIQRLKIKYPHKRKPRLPFLQQELLGTREIIRRYEQGRPASKISRELGLKEEAVSALCEVLDLYGSKICGAVLACVFFSVSRAGDLLPQNRSDFDPEVDSTVADAEWAVYGVRLRFKLTKTGHNPEFDAKPLVESKGNPLCPVTALVSYLTEYRGRDGYDEALDETNPLFQTEEGKVFVTGDLRRLAKAAVYALGKDPKLFGAHSLRIGGATAAIAAPSGDEHICSVLGYWLTSVVREYTKPGVDSMVKVCREMMESKHTEVLQ